MSDTSDTGQGTDEGQAYDPNDPTSIRRATGFDDGATIDATDPDASNDERYPAGAQTGDTDAETGDTEANTDQT